MSNQSIFLKLFGVKGQVKVIQTLFENGDMTITQIAKATSINNKWARKHINALLSHEVVTEKSVGSIRIYSLNRGDPVVDLITSLIELLQGMPK